MDPFAAIPVELGPSAYAEPFVSGSLWKMPANAAVNAAYLLVGAYWLMRAPEVERGRGLVRAFAFASIVYAFVQLARITTQTRAAAIVDQWTTLPFFALVIAFALELSPCPRRGLQVAIIVGSMVSYLLALIHPLGFEIALAIHIVAAVSACLYTLRRETLLPFLLALLCCLGFVFLKLADFRLATMAPFQRLTGHFWSKVCDALQIHFVLVFFVSSRLPGRPLAPNQMTTAVAGRDT